MRERDYDQVFGTTPADFTQNVWRTLNQIEDNQKKIRRAPMKMVLLAAVVVVLLAGTALAISRSTGVLDMREGALPEAREAVTDLTPFAAFESPNARYLPTEVLIDNGNLLMTIETTAVDPAKHRLAGSWGNICADTDDKGLTAYELAVKENRVLLSTDISIIINGENMGGNIAETLKDDVLTAKYSIQLPQDIELDELEITLKAFDQEQLEVHEPEWDEPADGQGTAYEDTVTGAEHWSETTFAYTPTILSGDRLYYKGPFVLEYITIDWVEFNLTAASLGMKAQYSYNDDLTEEQRHDLMFTTIRLADPTGQKDVKTFDYTFFDCVDSIPGVSSDWSAEQPDDPRTFVQESSWPAIEEWPETLELYIYYKEYTQWSKPLALKPSEANSKGE